MSEKRSKGTRIRNAFKSEGHKVVAFTKSRVVRRSISLFGLIAIFKPGASYAFTLEDGGSLLAFGKNSTIMVAEYNGLKEITRQGVSAIPSPGVRTAVSTVGSTGALVAGLGCGVGSAICGGMGWEQKAMICLHGVSICAGVASGVNEADPLNLATLTGRVVGEAVGSMTV